MAFMARFKEFQGEPLKIVVHDLRLRSTRRRRHRTGRKNDIAFILAVIQHATRGTECPLTLKDYAFLARTRTDKFSKFANKNPAFARVALGPEWDRAARREPLKDRNTGQEILSRDKRLAGPKDDIKPGPPASRLSYLFNDYSVKQELKTNPDFRRGFFEGFCEEALCELIVPVSSDKNLFTPLSKMADEISQIGQKQLEAMFKVWSDLLKRTGNRLQELIDSRLPPEVDYRFVSNCKETVEMLAGLREETKKDIEVIRKAGGSISSGVRRLFQPLLDRQCSEDEELSEFLHTHHDKLYDESTRLMRISVMIYYTNPTATKEWEKNV